jgi:hypothetical protein
MRYAGLKRRSSTFTAYVIVDARYFKTTSVTWMLGY